MEDIIPQTAIDSVAQHINQRTNKQCSIPIVGDTSNPETPQIFEIIPLDQIDKADLKFYAIDGSSNSHSFYNGVSIGLYQAGYDCFHMGKQLRMNDHNDPILGNPDASGDRLANASYQIVIEGTSYRERLSPHRRKEVLTV